MEQLIIRVESLQALDRNPDRATAVARGVGHGLQGAVDEAAALVV